MFAFTSTQGYLYQGADNAFFSTGYFDFSVVASWAEF